MKIAVTATNFEVTITNEEGEFVAKVAYDNYAGAVDIAAAIRGGLTIATLLEAGRVKLAAAVKAAEESTSAE